MEEPAPCPVCVVFEPQAWRKSLCRNCFKTFEQHQEELEAALASGVPLPSPGQTTPAKQFSPAPGSKESTPKPTDRQPTPPASSGKAASPIPTIPPTATAQSSTSSPSSSSVAAKQSPPSASKPGVTVGSKSASSSPPTPSTTSTKTTTATAATTATTTTTTTTTTTPSGKSSLASSLSKAKDVGSRSDEGKAKPGLGAGKWGGGSAGTIGSASAGKSAGNGGSTTAGKTGRDKKVSLVAALAGKIDPSKRDGADVGEKDSVLSANASAGTVAEITPESKKSAGVADKKSSSLGKAGKDTTPTAALPESPSPALSENSTRAKWEKRATGPGGGSGSGGGGGSKGTDVSKGQKGSEGKAGEVANTTAGSLPAKGKAVVASTIGKDGQQPEPATTTATAGKKFSWDKASTQDKSKTSASTTSPATASTTTSSKSRDASKSTPKSPKSGRLSLKTATSTTASTPSASLSPKSPTPTSPSVKSPTFSSPLRAPTSLTGKKDVVAATSATSPGPASPTASDASPASPTVDTAVKKDSDSSPKSPKASEDKSAKKDLESASKTSKESSEKGRVLTPKGLRDLSAVSDEKPAEKKQENLPKTSKDSNPPAAAAVAADEKSSKKDLDSSTPTDQHTPTKSTTPTTNQDSNDDVEKTAQRLADKEKALKELQNKHLSLKIELEAREDVLKDELAAKQQALQELRQKQADQEEELIHVKEQLVIMEKECQQLRKDAEEAKHAAAVKGKREEWEKTLTELRTQVTSMEEQCSRLEGDNQSLLSKLRGQEQRANQVVRDNSNGEVSGLQGELRGSEIEVEELRDENEELRQELLDMRREMDEMYDTFRENELDEFRELQRELDLTAKNCRVLQFKLRKSERRAEQVDRDRQHYEEKLRSLQSQFESGDARCHIEALEEELRTAKEVSVRLHDELDIVEDRRNKALEENRHLTELLEATDKKQFRLEMEIDKLRDQVADLKQQLRERSPTRKEGTPDRRDVLGRQGSQEYDSAQLMRDLCDSVERETDLKEQLKFLEEESRMMRRKLAEMEDENEALRVQLKKLSLKASRWKEESVGRAHSSDRKQGQGKDDGEGQGSDKERERLDSSDDEANIMTLKLQMALLEQELMTSHRTQAESEKEADKLREEVTSLQEQLRGREHELVLRREQEAPPTPSAYYEEKVRDLTAQADELRWRIIEKDREIERLSTASMAHARHVHHDHHSHHGPGSRADRQGRLKKSKSLDSDPIIEDLRRQLEAAQHEIASLRHQVTMAREQREEADKETTRLRLLLLEAQQRLEQRPEQVKEQQPPGEATPVSSPTAPLAVPSVKADDAAIENIELRDQVKRGEEELRGLREQVRVLTDKLHALSRAASPRLGSSAGSTPSPLSAPSAFFALQTCVPDDSGTRPVAAATPKLPPSPSPATASTPAPAPADVAEPASNIPRVPKTTHDVHEQLREAEEQKRVLARKMAQLEEANARLQALVSEAGKTTAAGDNAGEGSTKKKMSVVEKRVVTVGENESKEALMDKILDLEDEINDLLAAAKKRDEETASQSRELTTLREELQDARDVGRRMELQLLKELDMLHDKNTVLSNLLDIVQERCDEAEAELEKFVMEHSSPSTRSASAVSAISALSDASCGSDEVFLLPPSGVIGDKGQVIHRDWEAKLKNRIDSLERLLAEERHKVSMAEKKLLVSGDQTVAPSVSDDVKLRLREKELLQEELSECHHHLRLATDQVRGMRERQHALEEEHHRLKVDYGKLCTELDRGGHGDVDSDREQREWESDHTTSDSDKTPENSVEPEPELVSLRAASLQQTAAPPHPARPATTKDDNTRTKTDSLKNQGVAVTTDDVRALQHDIARYKLKSEQLEYKVEEISDIWRSKSAATEREKQGLELQLRDKSQEISQLIEAVQRLQQELKTKESEISKVLALKEEHVQEVARREAAETELHVLVTQTADREQLLRELRETVRTRDERLKEKDDIIHYLNDCLEQRQRETEQMTQKMAEMTSQREITSSAEAGKGVGGETDFEKENARLRETTRALREELAQGDTNRHEAEKSRRTFEAASLGWEKQKADLQASLNIAEEKLRLYETLSTTSTEQVMEGIKKESIKYFEEKECLKAQVTSLSHQLMTFEKSARETVLRLQQDLNHKLQQLREEAETNQRLMAEVQRLRTQNERAYRVQQEERLLRAEHQAMKIRYETRQEKLSQEYSKLLVTVDRLQKERQADRELVAGVQKAMTLIRGAHEQDQMRWEEERARLDNQLKEVAETQKLVQELRQKTGQLRDQLGEQERARTEVVNKFTTERAAWEIGRSKLHSRINQLEEQLHRSKKNAGSTTAMETAWAKERAQQQRLLSEAHDLALDLQRQLQARDQEAAQQHRHLVEKFEAERQTWDRERQTQNKLLAEMEVRVRRLGSLQKHVLEVQERADRHVQQACRERSEVTRRLAETRQQQARDARALDDVMTGLVRLRELGAMIAAEEAHAKHTPDTASGDLNKDIIKYIREAVVQTSKAADELTKRGTRGNGHIRRSLSSSELELLREELEDMCQEGGDVFPAHDVTKKSHPAGQSSLQKSVSLDSHASPSDATLPSILRSFPASRMRTRTPAYASGSRSAQNSRATSPADVGHIISPDISPSVKAAGNLLPSVSPQFSEVTLRPSASGREGPATRQMYPVRASSTDSGLHAPHTKRRTSAEHTIVSTAGTSVSASTATSASGSASTAADNTGKKANQRPRTLTKSLSVDSTPAWTPTTTAPTVTGRSLSASTTPTQPQAPSALTSTSTGNLTTQSNLTASSRSIGGLSPRTARRKFFEQQPASQGGFLSWPERGRSQSVTPRALHVPGVDPGEVRRVAEEEHEWLLSRVVDVPSFPAPAMRTSTSWDEKMHHRVVITPTGTSPSPTGTAAKKETHEVPSPWEIPTSVSAQGQIQNQGQGQSSARERRKLWKKSSSLDSSVGSCIARAGMQTVAPAVPAAFPPPSDLLAAVKSKLAPVFGRKSGKDDQGQTQPRPPSPLFIPTTVPDIPLRPSSATTTSSPLAIPQFADLGAEGGHVTSRDLSSAQSRGRGGRRQEMKRESGVEARDTRWRSQSADRATRPLLVHTDVIRPAQVWQFSETPV